MGVCTLDKPPVLSALGAAVYAPLFLSGVTLAGSAATFVVVNWMLVAIFAATSAALTLIALRHLLAHLPVPPGEADLLTIAFGFASLLLPYAVTFNNHIAAAALIISAFALVELEPRDSRPSWRRLCAGALAGFATVIDLPAGGAVLIVLGTWLFLRRGLFPWQYVVGAMPPLVLHSALQAMVTGTALPAEMYPAAFLYPGSYWTTTEAAIRPVPRWQFALEFMVGPSGWLTLTPVLMLGLISAITIAVRRNDRLQPAALAVASVTGLVTLYYVWLTRRTDFAGQSYGTRHLLALSPLVYFFSCVFLFRTRSRAARALFALLTLVGFVYAVYGMYDPWTRVDWRRDTLLLMLQRLVPYPWSSYSR